MIPCQQRCAPGLFAPLVRHGEVALRLHRGESSCLRVVCGRCRGITHDAGLEDGRGGKAQPPGWDMQKVAAEAGKMLLVLCFRQKKKTPHGIRERGWRQEQDVGQIHLKAFRSDKWQIPTSHARVHFSFLRNGVGWPPVAPSDTEGWPFAAARLRAPSLRCARTARLKGWHRRVAFSSDSKYTRARREHQTLKFRGRLKQSC